MMGVAGGGCGRRGVWQTASTEGGGREASGCSGERAWRGSGAGGGGGGCGRWQRSGVTQAGVVWWAGVRGG